MERSESERAREREGVRGREGGREGGEERSRRAKRKRASKGQSQKTSATLSSAAGAPRRTHARTHARTNCHAHARTCAHTACKYLIRSGEFPRERYHGSRGKHGRGSHCTDRHRDASEVSTSDLALTACPHPSLPPIPRTFSTRKLFFHELSLPFSVSVSVSGKPGL